MAGVFTFPPLSKEGSAFTVYAPFQLPGFRLYIKQFSLSALVSRLLPGRRGSPNIVRGVFSAPGRESAEGVTASPKKSFIGFNYIVEHT